MSFILAFPLASAMLLPTVTNAHAAPVAMTQEDAIRTELAAILADAYDVDGPGALVIVTKGGETLLHAARGMADLSEGRGMVPTERYHLASVTKMLVATTVAKLAEDGVLSLDDPISAYVPGFPEPARDATIRQLLNHTSGLRDITKKPGWIRENRGREFSDEELVALLASLEPKAAPGEEWEYNNSGYMLLGPIIAKATGEPWQRVMERLIARPLGLHSFMTPGVTMRGHDGPDASAATLPIFVDKGIAGASGGIVGTTADLATFSHALHHGGIIGDDMYAQATSLPVLNDGEEARYGFGFRIGRLLGNPTYYQGGSMAGTRNETLYVPAVGVFVAVLANSDAPMSQPRPLAERLAAAAMGRPLPRFEEQPLDIARAMPMIGTYEVEGKQVQLLARDGTLWFAPEGSSARPVRYFGDRRFFFEKDRADWFEFVRGANGEPVLRYHDPADVEPIEARRVGGVEERVVAIDPRMLAAFVGSYRTETDVTVNVERTDDGQLRMRQGEKEESAPLRALSETLFAIDGTPMKLEFVLDGDVVTGMKIFRGARTMEAARLD